MAQYTTIAEFWSAYDAAAACSALQAYEIDAINVDWHFFHIYPQLTSATNAVRVWVRNDQLENAKAILQEGFDCAEPNYPCPQCGNRTYRMRRWLVIILVSWVMGNTVTQSFHGFFGFFRRKRFCWTCHHQHLPSPVEPFTEEELGYDPNGPNIGDLAKRTFHRFMALRKL